MSTRVTMIRHGQSTWNAIGRSQGQAPVPLSTLGHRQAAQTAQAVVQDGPIEAVYCSDLVRCRQTVAPLADVVGLPVHYDVRLREVDVGTWQGLVWAEREAFDPDNYAAYIANPMHVSFPGGESLHDMQVRVVAALKDILIAHPTGHVVIVTHGGPIRAALRHFGLWPYEFWAEDAPPVYNASRTVLHFNGAEPVVEVVLMADVSHLAVDAVT